ncbi:MAG TPA: hypothetical protein VIF62_36595 [Labilithrix sp.]
MARSCFALCAAAWLACAPPQGDDAGATEGAVVSASSINGGSTGAMVRETTGAGFRCVTGTWTVPDADPKQAGEPWIYYGLGDENGVDMEAGMSFQRGDGTAAKPHRWLPYLRRGSTFIFGDESTRALPGATFELELRLDDGRASLFRDGQRITFVQRSSRVDSIAIPLDPASAHVRRVVGQALSTPYHGEDLGRLGPVVFAHSRLCAADGGQPRFHDEAGWTDVRNGVLYGSVRFPSTRITHVYDANLDEDRITLFP